MDCVTWFLNGIIYYSEIFKSIGALGTMVTALVAFVKYKNEKDKELYLKRLNEVYAPLYLYLTKQEAVREIFSKFNAQFKSEYEKEKIFEFGDNESSLFKSNEFIEIATNVDKSLMTPKLINLIGAYQAVKYMWEDSLEDNIKTCIKNNRLSLSKKIVDEVISEYKKCIKKIGMDSLDYVIDIETYEIDNL